jgi:hypothetical protein
MHEMRVPEHLFSNQFAKTTRRWQFNHALSNAMQAIFGTVVEYVTHGTNLSEFCSAMLLVGHRICHRGGGGPVPETKEIGSKIGARGEH